MAYTQSNLIKKLTDHTCRVTFNKISADGEVGKGRRRVMNCTLNPSLIPKSEHPRIPDAASMAAGVVVAWDLDKQDWRSFIPKTVETVVTE